MRLQREAKYYIHHFDILFFNGRIYHFAADKALSELLNVRNTAGGKYISVYTEQYQLSNDKQRTHPTEKHEYPAMLLEDLGNGQADVGVGPERVEEELSGDEPFPLQSPNINLLLAVCKCAVARVQALFSNGHL